MRTHDRSPCSDVAVSFSRSAPSPVRTGVAAALVRDAEDKPARYRRILEGFTGVPATDGNRVEALRNGNEIFPAMLDAISHARRTIDFLTYVYWTGEITRRFAAALAERAEAGVRVRVLLDSFGARQMDDQLVTRLREAGADVEYFRPYASWKVWKYNLRTHRRVLVVDEEVAFTGGVGISEEWMGDARGPDEWRDTHYRIHGPAVDGVQAAFYSDWLETPNRALDGFDRFPPHEPAGSTPVQVLRGSSQPGWNDMALALRALIDVACQHINVTSAYFRPPHHFVRLLGDAVDRGVVVRVLVPGPHAEPVISRWASERMYADLLDKGVELWQYQPSMHHAKIVTVDGYVAFIGTANFDSRSVALNEQIGLLVHDRGFTERLDDDFERDLEESRRVTLEQWSQRGLLQRARERAVDVATYGLRAGGAGRT